ncbi:hypothetical protein DA83_03865 [Pseudomonas sp. 250J]|uniref:DUF3077 domain-containing protein n=1 Tax=Pseudomonas peradeniyensis TaxID=2745488 RepID=A0ABT2VAU4_9PSED|nr:MULTISPECIES: hypothetical protein [Pseudomonas]MBI6895391.1 hypothetical protein [Pseudomonas putida]KNX77080.1 hypothetical protein DA83_03865 [Pseudomonas sp. 250J]MCU7238512.1 hypothetical protein [Pseudomonas peradeniyensis]MCU7281093.1 hypothetical protein [Pseudomonas peradeniyensis]QZA52777.1 hypothetical protein K2O50_17345 [Pseudomonas sp. 2hn]
MLKIVPDPPPSNPSPHHLEDTLIQATEYVRCALIVAHQSVLASHPHSLGATLALTAVHEMETVRALLDSALTQVQVPVQVQTHH